MPERMDIFFENRLVGYDEHMLTSIDFLCHLLFKEKYRCVNRCKY